MDVQFAGAKLTEAQREVVKKHVEKLGKTAFVSILHVHIKRHKKAGDRLSYTVQLRANTKRGLRAAEETSWDFSQCLKDAFKKLENEIKA